MERPKAAKLAAAALLQWHGSNYGDYLEAMEAETFPDDITITPEEWEEAEQYNEYVLEAVAEYIMRKEV